MLAGIGRFRKSPDLGIRSVRGMLIFARLMSLGSTFGYRRAQYHILRHHRYPPRLAYQLHAVSGHLPTPTCTIADLIFQKKKLVVETCALARFSSLRSIRVALLGRLGRATRESADRHSPRSMICAGEVRDETGFLLGGMGMLKLPCLPYSLVVRPTLHRRLSQHTLRLACESSILSLLLFSCQIADLY